MDPILWKILPVYASAIVLHCHYWHLYLSGCYSLCLFESKNVSCELNPSNGLSAAKHRHRQLFPLPWIVCTIQMSLKQILYYTFAMQLLSYSHKIKPHLLQQVSFDSLWMSLKQFLSLHSLCVCYLLMPGDVYLHCNCWCSIQHFNLKTKCCNPVQIFCPFLSSVQGTEGF